MNGQRRRRDYQATIRAAERHDRTGVANAAQRDNPGYLETTYRDGRNWLAYNMK